MDINIKLNETEYSELISLLYWCVLEQDIRYNDDFESMCNAVRTADGSKLEDNDPYLVTNLVRGLEWLVDN